MDNTSLIFRSIPPNGQKYIEEKLGRLLNTAMIQFITDGKKMGDYDKFLQDNDLVEEKEYHFIKTDEEPSSPVTKTEGFPSFDDPSGKLVDIINTIRSKEEEDKSKPEKVIPTQKYLQKKRKAVFSNPADVLGQDSSFVAPKYDKSESEGNKIKAALMNNMLTKKLSVEAVNTLIGAMQSRSYKKGDVIIQFGEEGKEYFILDSGVWECKVYSEESKEVIVTKSITEGNAFGELALLYQTPRSATIIALTDCNTWVLDQMTFKTVIMASAIKERNIRLQLVDKVKFLDDDQIWKIKLLDGFEVLYFAKDEIIVKEGDLGEQFYIIEDGRVQCIKEENNEIYRELGQGDFFGELALIEQEKKRTLTVKALEDCKLLALNRDTFFRVIGPFKNFLKKDYKDY